MTHSELLIRIISKAGNISFEEASFIFAAFKASFIPPWFIDHILSEEECEAMYDLYLSNKDLMAIISRCVDEFRHGLPSA